MSELFSGTLGEGTGNVAVRNSNDLKYPNQNCSLTSQWNIPEITMVTSGNVIKYFECLHGSIFI